MNSPPSKYPRRKSRTKILYHQQVIVRVGARLLMRQNFGDSYYADALEHSIRYLRGDDLKSAL